VDGERSASCVKQQHVDVQVSAAAVVPHQTGEDRAHRSRLCRRGRANCPAHVPEHSRYQPRGVDVGGAAAVNEHSARAKQRSTRADQRSPATAATPAASPTTSGRGHRLSTGGFSALLDATRRTAAS
jgi:hypothetical protein